MKNLKVLNLNYFNFLVSFIVALPIMIITGNFISIITYIDYIEYKIGDKK